MAQTVAKPKRIGANKARRSEALIQRSIRAYELSLDGLSVRAICDELGIKSTQTCWLDINRGKDYVLEHGVDIEIRKIEIDKLFRSTLGALAEEIQAQRKEGRTQTIERSDGTSETRTYRGIDPRTAEALARSADRWAQFLGITDRGPETGPQQTTFIQLAAPSDGAAFSAMCSAAVTEASGQGEAIDAEVTPEADPPQAQLARS
jgi:hypothetical protein